MNINEYRDCLRPEEVRRREYEQACRTVPSGMLSSHDVCRLFANQPYSEWSKKPGQTARTLVTTLGLPLMETSAGRYMIAHTIEGLEVPHE